jgi:hypothetical protein
VNHPASKQDQLTLFPSSIIAVMFLLSLEASGRQDHESVRVFD